MTAFEYVMIFIVCWWMGLFMVLPFGIRSQHELTEPGATYAAAPQAFSLRKKLVYTTILACIFTVVVSVTLQQEALWIALGF